MSLGFVSVDFRNPRAVIEPPKTEKYEYVSVKKQICIQLDRLTDEELRTREVAVQVLSQGEAPVSKNLRIDFSDYLTSEQGDLIKKMVNVKKGISAANELCQQYGSCIMAVDLDNGSYRLFTP